MCACARVVRSATLGEGDNFARDFFLWTLRALPDVLDHVPVVVARPERHRLVVAARILAQQLLSRALRFDEILPVESRYRAKTRDAVGDGYLSQSNPAVRSRGRFFSARSILRYPLLEPDQRGEIRLVRPHLLEESRDPRWRERRMIVDERRECRRECLRRFLIRFRSTVAARSADSTSFRRAATRRAIRRMFSTRPSRSIVGIAHSSPIRSDVTV